MSSMMYTGDRARRAIDTSHLEKRIEINRAYSSANFDEWLLSHLKVNAGEDILDVGCGSGSQTIPFATLVGPTGSVSALDISSESIDLLKSRLPPAAPVQAVAADMAELANVISTTFKTKNYSLAHSSYALYYSTLRLEVLNVMRCALKPGGRCAVFTPNEPHGLVDLASRFMSMPEAVTDSLQFGPAVLQPYFERNFSRVEIHHFNNTVSVPSSDVLIEFYLQTTYYDARIESDIRTVADAAIAHAGSFRYDKNGYLIMGFRDA